ncbi:hypothetical protein [Algivirga pacifica]|uniref:KTSC domain-containing protein n=1 Tax=Algivirga pacifica TaxID=1162670 RepID=A0ABP9D673_9BACT
MIIEQTTKETVQIYRQEVKMGLSISKSDDRYLHIRYEDDPAALHHRFFALSQLQELDAKVEQGTGYLTLHFPEKVLTIIYEGIGDKPSNIPYMKFKNEINDLVIQQTQTF